MKETPELTKLDKALGATYPGQIEEEAKMAKIVIGCIIIGLISFLVFSFFYTPTHPQKKGESSKHTNPAVTLDQ